MREGHAPKCSHKILQMKDVQTFLLLPSFFLSVGVSMPIPVIGLHNKDKVFVNGSCVLNEERFVLIGSFVAFFIPLVIMVVTYCLTIQVGLFFSCLCDCSSLQHASVVMSLLYCLHLCPLPFRCFRGRPQSSCMRQRLLPSSLCTHQQWEIHCSLHPAPSTFLRSIHLLLQTHKVNTYQDFTAPVCQQQNLPLT